jgi:hypothetical protein
MRSSSAWTPARVQTYAYRTLHCITPSILIIHPVRWFCLFMFLTVTLAFAAPARAAEPGEELTIKLITFQPGDLVFEKFGHNAIWVHDEYAPAGDRDVLYHWGLFEFEQKRFFIKYALGEMDYRMGGFPGVEFEGQVNFYADQNRSIWAQELNLTPAQRVKLQRVPPLEFTAGERDLSIQLLHRQLLHPRPRRDRYGRRWAAQSAARKEANRHHFSLAHPPLHAQRSLLVRRAAHGARPGDGSQDQRLGRSLSARPSCAIISPARRSSTASGATVPLVKNEQVLFQSTRPPEAAAPPNWIVQFFLTGLAIGGIFIALERWARRKRAGRICFSIATTLVTALVGIGAAISLWFWLGSQHWAAWRNESLLAWSPLALPLASVLPVLYRAWPRARRAALYLSLTIVATTILGILLCPFLPQNNAEPMAFILPINLALAWCIWRITRPPPSPTPKFDLPAATAG